MHRYWRNKVYHTCNTNQWGKLNRNASMWCSSLLSSNEQNWIRIRPCKIKRDFCLPKVLGSCIECNNWLCGLLQIQMLNIQQSICIYFFHVEEAPWKYLMAITRNFTFMRLFGGWTFVALPPNGKRQREQIMCFREFCFAVDRNEMHPSCWVLESSECAAPLKYDGYVDCRL